MSVFAHPHAQEAVGAGELVAAVLMVALLVVFVLVIVRKS